MPELTAALGATQRLKHQLDVERAPVVDVGIEIEPPDIGFRRAAENIVLIEGLRRAA
jgi:hypothetical protein